jgi:hypothetical protein
MHFTALRRRLPFHLERSSQHYYVAHSKAIAYKRNHLIVSVLGYIVVVNTPTTPSLILTQPIDTSTSTMDKRTPAFGRSASMPLFQQPNGEQIPNSNGEAVREEQYSALQRSPGFQSFRDQQARVWSPRASGFAGSPRKSTHRN